MLVQIKDDDTLSFFLDETAGFRFLEVYVETQQIQPEATPQNYQQGGYMANPKMSQQWGEYMSLLANEGLPSSCNPDFGTGTSNPDFGAGTSNVDFGAGQVQQNPSYGIKHVIQTVKDHTGYDIPYQKAWYSLKMAREIVYGTWEINRHKMLIAAAMDGNQQDLCWRAGSEYQIRKFNRIMEEIKSQNVAAFEFLDKINKEKWTASHDGGWRTGILTTNMSECINGVLKGARRLPLTAIVEITLVRTVNYFVTRERRSHAMVANGQLWTDFAYKMFNQWHQKSIDHTVTKYNHRQQSASVVTKRQSGFGLNTHVVKITNRECSCGKWTQFGIPCSHAQKVCAAYNINAASMVKNYYDVQAYKNTYSKAFQPLYPDDYWDAPEFRLVHDTTIRISTRPGRNQTSRIHNEMDWRQTRERQQAQQRENSSRQ
ncbi:UNVERIFIED_CONTAM: hypothetical protein Sradi_3218600 [Sesamum radiatum]|uniref:SWIM-type domain-containing protein n=1 Tax=Sesamum radiatum TaxID=300843 RepID=A0AAW2RGF8_SESRA